MKMPALAVSVNDDKKLIDRAGAGSDEKEYSKEVQQRVNIKGG